MKMKYFIDSHKGATSLWVISVMAYFDRWDNTVLWIYLALHGTYGILWCFKSHFFGDQSWEQTTSWYFGIFGIWGGLSFYWIRPCSLQWKI